MHLLNPYDPKTLNLITRGEIFSNKIKFEVFLEIISKLMGLMIVADFRGR